MDKKAYEEKLDAQLKEWKADLNKLQAKAEKKIEYQERELIN